MAALAQAFVAVRPDTRTFEPDLRRKLDRVDTTAAAKKTGSKWGGAFGKAAGAFAAIGILKFGKDSAAAFSEAEVAQNRLSDAFDKFPRLADVSKASLQALNTELSKKTRFDDDATASGQAVLAQFKLTGTQVRQLTPLLQDYAAKTGKDLPTAARDLGRAMLGQGRALKAVGINFKDTGSTGGNLESIMAGLRTQVGGFAEREGKTAAGQSKILDNQFGELEETAGSKLVPALVRLTGVGLAVVDFISRNQKVIVPLVGAFAALAAITWTVNKATAAWAAIQKVATVATKLWTAGQWLLNAALTANPIGLVIAAVALLVVGIVIAYKRSETFRQIVKKLWDGLRLGALTAVSFVLTMIDKWLGALQTALSFMGKLPGPFGKPFRAMADGVEAARGKVRQLKDGVDALKPKTVPVTVAIRGVDVTALPANAGIRFGGTGRLAAAYGGRIPGVSASDRSDNIRANLTAGEYVIQRPTVRKLDAKVPGFLDLLNAGQLDIGGDKATMAVGTGRPLKFAAGGLVARTQGLIRRADPLPYIWGGASLGSGFDCSGLTGAAYGELTGKGGFRGQRYFTTDSNFAALGFRPGLGTYSIGVTAGRGHMLGNLAGLKFEARSTQAGILVGPAAGDVRRMARQYYLPSVGGRFGGMPELTKAQRSSVVRQVRPRIVDAIFKELGVRQYDAGGVMPPGIGVYRNNTRRPETVTTAQSMDAVIAELRSLRRAILEHPTVVAMDSRPVARAVRQQNVRNSNGWG